MERLQGDGRPRRVTIRENIVSGREIAFIGLQALIPASFALIPPIVYVIGLQDKASAVHRLADGTLILIAFTMLISLSQDLQQAVRPYHRQYVEKIELMLRVFAICILAAYSIAQSVGMLVENKVNELRWVIDALMFCLSLSSFIISIVLVIRVLKMLRPHFLELN